MPRTGRNEIARSRDSRPGNWQDTPRLRVIERLEAALTYPVALIVAPAGFGKTTALKHLIRDRPDAIYVRTRRESSLEMFVRDFASSCSALLPTTMTPPVEPISGPAAFLEICVLWAITHLRGANCLVVIDDLQFGETDPAIAIFIARMVESTKDTVRWILSTRSRGTLPITRWQAYGDADAPITAEDLRMTLDEAIAIAAMVGSPASTGDLARWLAQTGGFAVPLSYAIRLSARRSNVDGIIDGTRAVTFDFLAEQLWSSLPEDDRFLLELSAFLPPTHVHDLEESGIVGATRRLARLTADVAFVSLKADGIFAMHDLFRDFIRGQINLAGPIALRDCVRNAARVLLNAKQCDEAIRLLVAHKDLEQISQVLESDVTTAIDHATTGAIVDAFKGVDPSILSIELLALHTEHWAWNNHWHKSRLYAVEILGRELANSNQVFKALRETLRAVYLDSESGRRKWLETSATHINRLNKIDRTVYDAFRASILAQLREYRGEAQVIVRDVSADDLDGMEPKATIDTHIGIANACFYLGEINNAVLSARAAVATARTLGDLRETARTLNTLGIMLTYSRDSELETLFEPLRAAVEQSGSWRYSQISHWSPAVYFGFKGDLASAERARELQNMVLAIEESQRQLLISFQRHGRNLGHLIAGNYSEIVNDHLKIGSPQEPDQEYSLLVDTATAYSLLSDVTASNSLLKRAHQLRASFSHLEMPYVAESFVLESICLGANGLWAQARRLIQLTKAFPSTYAPLHLALERFMQGPPFSGLSDALISCEGRPFIGLSALVLRRLADRLSNRNSEVHLTNAELTVLQLLVLGKSNKEIADARNRSSETVKRQVASLYRKLGVENRTSALAVARDRGLL